MSGGYGFHLSRPFPVLRNLVAANGAFCPTTEFHGMDPELLQKALGVLVKRGKAQIFGQEDSQGVKFF